MKQLRKIKLNEEDIMRRLSHGEMDYLLGGNPQLGCGTGLTTTTTTTTSSGPLLAGCFCTPTQRNCVECVA